MNKKIIFSGGGTGGHIFPAINLMKHFIDRGYEVILVTDKRGRSFIKNYPASVPPTLSVIVFLLNPNFFLNSSIVLVI